jgi:predicted aldo/keto reductase-like oxidoreductase
VQVDRRRFLGSAGAGLAGGLAAAVPVDAAAPGIRRHVTLGRTGLEVSDISFGGSRLSDPALVRHAYARGVTYFDTAEGYRWGGSEEAVGSGLAGVRQRVVVASKTKAGAGDDRHDMMRALEGSLRRLRSDYVDIYYNHAVNDVERMRNPEWHEFTERAKRQGKIRFRGMSGHGSRLVEALGYALDHDLVDVILTAFSFGLDPAFHDQMRHMFHFVALQPELPPVLERARAKGVGVVAMKTLMGGRLNDMRPYESDGATFSQAALRWVLASGKADCALISMTSPQEIDEFVAASGATSVGAADMRLLARYGALQGPRYCQQGCDRCDGACPAGVPVAEVLRTRMYDVDYGDRAMARMDYAALGDGATACLGCVEQPCLNACPNGIPIAAFARDAAVRLG